MDVRGLFVVLEGGDGSGKTTHLRMLGEALAADGDPYDLLLTREPGGTDLGRTLRDLVLHGGHVDARAEALLYAADRAQHVADVVLPALAAGRLVLCDRYVDSSIAYQAVGRGLAEADVRAVNDFATAGLVPDVVLLLDIDPDRAAARMDHRDLDRLESAGSDFHRRVRDHYLRLASAHPDRYLVVDADGRRDRVHDRVLAALAPRLEAWAENRGTGPAAARGGGAAEPAGEAP